MEESYEKDFDNACPNCGHSPIHYRDCSNLACEDGYIDANHDDPINYMEGEFEYKCDDCNGTSVEKWCPSCSMDLAGYSEEYESED